MEIQILQLEELIKYNKLYIVNLWVIIKINY